MKIILQRVSQAKIEVAQQNIASIQQGILALVCVEPSDNNSTLNKAIEKILKIRIFQDQNDKMNLSLQDIDGALLLVSQFTLAANTSKGSRPSFTEVAKPEQAQQLFSQLIAIAKQKHSKVAHGIFAADMQIHLVNDGPVTIPLQI